MKNQENSGFVRVLLGNLDRRKVVSPYMTTTYDYLG
jgi:hypothetical protein